MNRTFLTELRQQFLQWRSLPRARMLEYAEQSRRLFAGPTMTAAPASTAVPVDPAGSGASALTAAGETS
jgi:hypothetical protein